MALTLFNNESQQTDEMLLSQKLRCLVFFTRKTKLGQFQYFKNLQRGTMVYAMQACEGVSNRYSCCRDFLVLKGALNETGAKP